jgi:hypothetical protein
MRTCITSSGWSCAGSTFVVTSSTCRIGIIESGLTWTIRSTNSINSSLTGLTCRCTCTCSTRVNAGYTVSIYTIIIKAGSTRTGRWIALSISSLTWSTVCIRRSTGHTVSFTISTSWTIIVKFTCWTFTNCSRIIYPTRSTVTTLIKYSSWIGAGNLTTACISSSASTCKWT